MDSETTFMSVSPGWQELGVCTTESCCGFSLRLQWIFLFLFLYFLSRCSGTNCITAPFQTHLDVTSQPARRHLVLFNLMLLFFFFHTHTNCVTLPRAGIHYLRETGEAPLQSSFQFFLLNSGSKRCVKPRESEAAIQCPGQVLLPRELRALSLDLIVSTCADGGPSHCLPRINPAAGNLFSAGIPLRAKRPEYKDAY